MPAANNGSGFGGSALQGSGIYLHDSSHVVVEDCEIRAHGAGRAFFGYAEETSQSDITIKRSYFLSQAAAMVGFARSDGNGFSGINVVDIVAENTGSTNYAISLEGCQNVLLKSKKAKAIRFDALHLSECEHVEIEGRSYVEAKQTHTN